MSRPPQATIVIQYNKPVISTIAKKHTSYSPSVPNPYQTTTRHGSSIFTLLTNHHWSSIDHPKPSGHCPLANPKFIIFNALEHDNPTINNNHWHTWTNNIHHHQLLAVRPSFAGLHRLTCALCPTIINPLNPWHGYQHYKLLQTKQGHEFSFSMTYHYQLYFSSLLLLLPCITIQPLTKV